jgi:two-component system NtrC family sensor kinase
MKVSERSEKLIEQQHERASRYEVSPAEPVAVELNELVKDAIAFTEDYARASRDERGVRVQFKTALAGNLSPVRASRNELHQVFVNLLRNAIDSIEGEGEITVRTHADSAQSLAEVNYTDAGISHEVQGQLFRTPLTARFEHETNLRLAACCAILRRLGGEIEVKSGVGEGTTFTISLPVAK